jgi:proliferating cell nuclear antigen
MFKIVLSNAELLKNTIPVISEIIDEGVLNIDKDGVTLLAPDRTMVSVVDFKIFPSAFEEYNVENPTSLGLNMANLTSVLKRAKSTDKIILRGGEGKLIIELKGKSTRTFEIPLLDIKTEKPPIDQLKFNARVELDSGIIEEGIEDAEVIGDAVFLEATPESFRMFARGDVSSSTLEIKKGEEGLLNITANGSTKAQYPLDYLKKMVKIGRLSKQAVIEFDKDYPLRLNFKIPEKMEIKFILAPRISEE